jgi:hypothetical protein
MTASDHLMNLSMDNPQKVMNLSSAVAFASTLGIVVIGDYYSWATSVWGAENCHAWAESRAGAE